MQGGFSFCGVDIAKYKLEYVPTLDQTYVFAGSNYEANQEVFDAHHGGYFYGTTVQPKDFILRCYFQDEHVSHGILTAIENFFRRGKTGKLVFENRKWLWYVATVVDIDLSDLRNFRNGFVTVTMRAYYPFARCEHNWLPEDHLISDYIVANSGLLVEWATPKASFENITESTDILLYNGGGETACVAVELAGEAGEGVTITNKTTGQTCRMVAFTKADTSDVGKYIIVDSLNGKTVLTDGSTAERSFRYHDYGFIELAPSCPIERDVYVSYAKGSDMVTVISEQLGDDSVGKHIMIGAKWYKIVALHDESTLILESPVDVEGFDYTNIVTMNEVHIELTSGSELTKLNFVYKPTFQ